MCGFSFLVSCFSFKLVAGYYCRRLGSQTLRCCAPCGGWRVPDVTSSSGFSCPTLVPFDVGAGAGIRVVVSVPESKLSKYKSKYRRVLRGFGF